MKSEVKNKKYDRLPRHLKNMEVSRIIGGADISWRPQLEPLNLVIVG